jgi:signal transduction histidine kinase
MSKRFFSIIEHKNSKLIQINATKDKFFSIVAHDLRSPFSNILGYIDLLNTQYQDFNEDERRKFIHEIDESSKNTFALLENLLLWAKSQMNKIEIKKVDLDVKEIITEAIKAYLPGADKKGIALSVNVPDKLIIRADKFSLMTVIANLFNNAVKFTPEKGEVSIDTTRSDHFIEISVSDNGVGIPPEKLPNLFHIDNSHSTPGTNKETGTGLGLLLCKEFVEKNGGILSVESELGKGTTFTFTIPV